METSLTHLQQSFAAWQSNSKKRHVSAALREQAVKCLDQHTLQEVSRVTGKCVKTLQSWKKSLHRKDLTDDSHSGFIAMNISPELKTDKAKRTLLSLQIRLSNGLLIDVSPDSINASVEFILALNKESIPCFI